MIKNNMLLLEKYGWSVFIEQEPDDEDYVYTEKHIKVHGPVRVMVLSGVVRTVIRDRVYFGEAAKNMAIKNPGAFSGIDYELSLMDLPDQPVVRLCVSNDQVEQLGFKERAAFSLGYRRGPNSLEPVAWRLDYD